MFDLDRTYEEPIGRYRVIYQYVYEPAEQARHDAELRLNGIDPADSWNLYYSSDDEVDARAVMDESAARWGKLKRFAVKDAGPDAPKTITRSVW